MRKYKAVSQNSMIILRFFKVVIFTIIAKPHATNVCSTKILIVQNITIVLNGIPYVLQIPNYASKLLNKPDLIQVTPIYRSRDIC